MIPPVIGQYGADTFLVDYRSGMTNNMVSGVAPTINGTPVFSRSWLDFNGSTDCLIYGAVVPNTAGITFIFKFWPDFAFDANSTYTLFDSTAGSQYACIKGNNGAGNVLSIILGNTTIQNITAGTYSTYWYKGQENTLVIAGTTGSILVYLNGNLLGTYATAWTNASTANFYIGADNAGANFFDGKIVYACIVSQKLTRTAGIQIRTALNDIVWPQRSIVTPQLNLKSKQIEDGLVGSWDLKPISNLVLDKSSTGKNGTVYGACYEQHHICDMMRFDGVDDYVDMGNTGQTVKTIAFWMIPDNVNQVIADLNAGTNIVSMVTGVMTATGWVAPKIYVDGILWKTVLAGLPQRIIITTSTGISASAFTIGKTAAASFYDGLLGKIEIYSDEKPESWVVNDFHNSKSIGAHTSADGIKDTVSDITSGNIPGTNIVVHSGTWKTEITSITGVTGSWVSPTGWSGSGWLNPENAYDGDTGTYAALQLVLSSLILTRAATNCNKIRIYGETPDASSFDLKVEVYYGGSYHTIWDGLLAENVWNVINIGSTESVTSIQITHNDVGNLKINEVELWEDIGGTVGNVEYRTLECVSAGLCYLPISVLGMTPTEAAYGTWEFDVLMVSGIATNVCLNLANMVTNRTTNGQTGYTVNISSDGAGNRRIYLQRLNPGPPGNGTDLFYTAADYISYDEKHTLRFTRTKEGIWIGYLDGVEIVESFGSNPVTENTYTQFDVITFECGAAGDKFYLGPTFCGNRGGFRKYNSVVVDDPMQNFYFTTTDITQNWIIAVTSGKKYWIDWGDGTVDSYTGSGGNQNPTHNYGGAGTYLITVRIENPLYLLRLDVNTNSLAGSVPDLIRNVNLIDFRCYDNGLSGSIPSLTSNTSLTTGYFYTNNLTGYVASIIPTTCTIFDAADNALTLTAVDQILIDFTTAASGLGLSGTLDLSGGTNATPTPAIKAACESALPGWTITTN